MSQWPDTRILDLLGIELPIIQAPMAGATGAAMVIAASNAGGLGSMPAALLSTDQLRGRAAVGQSQNLPIGSAGGTEQVTLLSTQIPQHTHIAIATSDDGTARTPVNNLYAKAGRNLYGPSNAQTVALHSSTLSSSGQTLPHDNMQPYSVLNFCILLQGIYPSRN